MSNILPNNETSLLVPGSVGQIEVLTAPARGDPKQAMAIICHPHPLFGGTMHNKVVTTLSRTFQNVGLDTVRFNFRGVGKSQGEYAAGEGETEDLLSIVSWVKETNPNTSLWLAGFSFGAYIAARAATQIELALLILVAPPVEHFPMAELPVFQAPCLVIKGDQDEVVPPQAVYDWINNRQPRPKLIRFPQTTHFFHGHLTELRKTLEEIFLSFP